MPQASAPLSTEQAGTFRMRFIRKTNYFPFSEPLMWRVDVLNVLVGLVVPIAAKAGTFASYLSQRQSTNVVP